MTTPRVYGRPNAVAPAEIGRVIGSGGVAAIGSLGLLAASVLGNLLLQGFEFPRYNNAFHVPIVLDYAASAEGPHDLFHQTLGAYVSALWPLLRSVVTEHNISAVFFSVYALNRAALVSFLYLAAAEISPRRFDHGLAAIVGAVILLLWPAWSLSPLAYNDIFVRALSQTELAETGLAACFWLMLTRRWLWAAAVLGAAFNFSAFIAIWGTVIAAAGYLWTNRDLTPPAALRRLFGLGLLIGAVASPTALWIAGTIAHAPLSADFDYGAYLEEFFPFHNLVHPNWTGAAIMASLALVVWPYVAERRLYRSSAHRDMVLAAFATVLAIVVFGAAQPYLFNSRLIACLFPLRMDSYVLLPLGIVLIATALAGARDARDSRRFWTDMLVLLALAGGNMPLALCAVALRDSSRRIHAAAAAGLVICAVNVAATGGMPVLFAGAGLKALGFAAAQALAAVLAVRERGDAAARLLLVSSLILPAVIGGEVSGVPRYAVAAAYGAAAASLLAGPAMALATLAALAAAFAVAAGAGTGGLVRMAGPIAGAVALFSIATRQTVVSAQDTARRLGPVVVIAACAIAGIGRAMMAGTLNNLPAEEAAVVDAAQWLRQNSEPDQLVLPLDIMEFATLSRRPVWVDRKMGAAVMWAPFYYPQWHERMAAVKALTTLDAAQAYARMNGIAYIVLRLADQDRLGRSDHARVIYANPHVAVLAVDPAEPRPH
jgi:hypothetical protein